MIPLATTALLVLLQLSQTAAAGSDMALDLPRDFRGDERLSLQVKVGRVPKGTEINLYTTDGKFLGSISPFGSRAGVADSTYTIPVPPGLALVGQPLRLSVTCEFLHQTHAATKDEVRLIRVSIVR
jgi:hypothetical protein